MRVARFAGLTMLVLLLGGCIEQDLKLTLHADGSGTLVVERRLSDAESALLLIEEPEPDKFRAMTMERTYRDSEVFPSRKIERSVYTFENLAEALPELEGEVDMMPRFTKEGDRLVVFLRHEMNPYHGMGSPDETNAFYNLEIEFPVPPESETGEVAGNQVAWKADAERLKELKGTDIGTLLFECSIPASAVQLDLRPRLVVPKEPKKNIFTRTKPTNVVSTLQVDIPIFGKNRFYKKGSNGAMVLHLPVAPARLPLSYRNLRVDELTIDGIKTNPILDSSPSGVFCGKDELGQDVAGLPIKIKFGWNSHTLETIDRIRVSMDAAVPDELSQSTLFVDSSHPTNAVLKIPSSSGKTIAVLGIDHARWQSAELTLASNLNPSKISAVYLDTNYGLRYPAKGIRWVQFDRASPPDRQQAAALFGEEEPVFVGTIYYPHIPTTSFGLLFSIVEKASWKKLTLQEENVHVR